MRGKKKRFSLDNGGEKIARLDVRTTLELRKRLENFCRENKRILTNVVTEALESYLESQKMKEKNLDNDGEKVARLDVRTTLELRKKLERFCKANKRLLTNVVTEALENYLRSSTKK
jgi:predicted DNA-binding protein